MLQAGDKNNHNAGSSLLFPMLIFALMTCPLNSLARLFPALPRRRSPRNEKRGSKPRERAGDRQHTLGGPPDHAPLISVGRKPVLALSTKIGHSADPSFAADIRHQPPVRMPLQDERFERPKHSKPSPFTAPPGPSIGTENSN